MNVASFQINHDDLLRGIYVSRKDPVGSDIVTTFDIRMKRPNIEPPMDTSVMHTLEHLIAVYLRSSDEIKDKVLYVGPMGCRTGMYIIFIGDFSPQQIAPYIIKSFEHVVNFSGIVPATESRECGNNLDHNLVLSQYEAKKYLDECLYCLEEKNMNYPD